MWSCQYSHPFVPSRLLQEAAHENSLQDHRSGRLQGTRTRQMFLMGNNITGKSCPVSTQDAQRHSPIPSMVLICPGCRKPMVFKGKKHILFSNGLTDLTYRCDTCDVETKRTVKEP